MNILEIHKYYYPRRGAEMYMLSIMDELIAREHNVSVFSMQHEKNLQTPWNRFFVDDLDTERLRLWQIPQYIGRAYWSRQAYARVQSLIDVFQPDIVHAHNIYIHLSPSVLQGCANKKVPVVLTVHDYGLVSGNYALWSGEHSLYPDDMTFLKIASSRYIKHSFFATAVLELINRIHRWRHMYDKYIDRYIAVSHAVKEVLVWSGIEEKKIDVLHNFADIQPLERSALPKGFFYYGALEKNKGILPLLEASESISEPLYIAGSGPLQNMVERAGNHIVYLGNISKQELSARLATVRSAIFPSLSREAYSTACLEALVAGTPVIVSDMGGFPEMVHEGEFGSIIQVGNVAQLTSAMNFAIHNQRDIELRAQYAKEWIQNHEGKKQHMDRLLAIFEEVMSAYR